MVSVPDSEVAWILYSPGETNSGIGKVKTKPP